MGVCGIGDGSGRDGFFSFSFSFASSLRACLADLGEDKVGRGGEKRVIDSCTQHTAMYMYMYM